MWLWSWKWGWHSTSGWCCNSIDQNHGNVLEWRCGYNFLTSCPRYSSSFTFLPFINTMPGREADSFKTPCDRSLFCDLCEVPADIYVVTLRRISCVSSACREQSRQWQNPQTGGFWCLWDVGCDEECTQKCAPWIYIPSTHSACRLKLQICYADPAKQSEVFVVDYWDCDKISVLCFS